MGKLTFDVWIEALDEDVIQGEYGYEPGEFTVYLEHWRPMWREGLTPQQAFQRALDAHAAARREEDERRAENWRRIQAEDAALIASLQQEQNP
jgi:hypothetical protein